MQQERQRWRRQRRLPTAGISTATSNGSTSGLHPPTVQALQKLELLPHSRWQHQQQAHQQDVHPTRPRAQSTRDEDQQDEWVSCRPPQENSTFGLQPRVPHPAPATPSHPSESAAASAPHQLNHFYAADDASRTLPPNALHGVAIQTYPSSGCSACSSRTRTSGGHNDDALDTMHVPSASSLLTIRGKQQ
jgi:hypothetical protein